MLNQILIQNEILRSDMKKIAGIKKKTVIFPLHLSPALISVFRGNSISPCYGILKKRRKQTGLRDEGETVRPRVLITDSSLRNGG